MSPMMTRSLGSSSCVALIAPRVPPSSNSVARAQLPLAAGIYFCVQLRANWKRLSVKLENSMDANASYTSLLDRVLPLLLFFCLFVLSVPILSTSNDSSFLYILQSGNIPSLDWVVVCIVILTAVVASLQGRAWRRLAAHASPFRNHDSIPRRDRHHWPVS